MTGKRRRRWLPRQGEPLCLAELVSQSLIKAIAYLPIYTAIVATLTFCAVVFGIPFLEGD